MPVCASTATMDSGCRLQNPALSGMQNNGTPNIELMGRDLVTMEQGSALRYEDEYPVAGDVQTSVQLGFDDQAEKRVRCSCGKGM